MSKWDWLIGREFADPQEVGGFIVEVARELIATQNGCELAVETLESNHRVLRDPKKVAPLVILYDLYRALDALVTEMAAENLHQEDDLSIKDEFARAYRALDVARNWLRNDEVEPHRDQYGDPVPKNLVYLPSPETLHWMGVEPSAFLSMDWYEVNGTNILLVPVYQVPDCYIDFHQYFDFEDEGLDPKDSPISYVSQPLHRYNNVDGFYHA